MDLARHHGWPEENGGVVSGRGGGKWGNRGGEEVRGVNKETTVWLRKGWVRLRWWKGKVRWQVTVGGHQIRGAGEKTDEDQVREQMSGKPFEVVSKGECVREVDWGQMRGQMRAGEGIMWGSMLQEHMFSRWGRVCKAEHIEGGEGSRARGR